MKNIKFLLLFNIIFLGFSCEKINEEDNCYSVKILKSTCGGVVLEILSDKIIGVEWVDFSENAKTYKNCVLVDKIEGLNKNTGDILTIDFKKVDNFKEGNFCDIGNLPSTKIEILNLCNSNE